MALNLIDTYRTALDMFGKIGRFDRSRSAQHHETFNHIFQFMNISRPMMLHEVGHRLRGAGRRGSLLASSHSFQEMIDQLWNIASSFSQRWNGVKDDDQSIIQIVPELLLLHVLCKLLIGC